MAFLAAIAPGPGCGRPPRHPAISHEVRIHLMHFEPPLLQVTVGDTVRWKNLDLVQHTVTSRKTLLDSGPLPPDSSWQTVIRNGGVLDYACRFHPTMTARIVAAP